MLVGDKCSGNRKNNQNPKPKKVIDIWCPEYGDLAIATGFFVCLFFVEVFVCRVDSTKSQPCKLTEE